MPTTSRLHQYWWTSEAFGKAEIKQTQQQPKVLAAIAELVIDIVADSHPTITITMPH